MNATFVVFICYERGGHQSDSFISREGEENENLFASSSSDSDTNVVPYHDERGEYECILCIHIVRARRSSKPL